MASAVTKLLSDQRVRLADGALQRIEAAVEKIKANGKNSLVVLSEFDFTLTKVTVDGQVGACTYGIIDTSPLMSDAYREEAKALKAHYLPMESNLDLSLEERKKAMDEWYVKAFGYHVKFGLKREKITEMVARANISLRSGVDDVFATLEQNGVPLVIFSAGVGDTLVETLTQQSSVRNNMHIISNRLSFDEEGVASSIPSKITTSYTKADPQAFESVADAIKDRQSVVLIGESLGDPDMLKGLPEARDVIKVGFLNHNVDKMLPTYLGLYDIVLTGDGDMSVIHGLLQYLLQ